MNENKVPCGGFEIDPTYFYVYEGQLELNAAFLDTLHYMPGYCAQLIQSKTNECLMDSYSIKNAISFSEW